VSERAPAVLTRARVTPTLPLVRFSRIHAVVSLGACAVTLALHAAWPFVVVGALSFALLLYVARGAHTPSGAFGWGNALTTLRFVLASSVGLAPPAVPTWALGVTTLVIFALDGLDGAVAKRRGENSEFGAYFDMEVDAYFVLLAGLALFLRARYGAWILSVGLLRYVYVLSIALVPARRGDKPRYSFGRHAFTALMLGLVLGMVLGAPFGTIATALGCGLVTASFAWSFYWSYSSPRR
jgi:phosphatidylglycerophosphate synthase